MPGNQYTDYLNLRNWPNTFKAYIAERKVELVKQKDQFFLEMHAEAGSIQTKLK